MELPHIHSDDDWLELREGEKAIITGNVRRLKSGNVLVGMTNWSDMAVESTLSGPEGHMSLVVERTEDGIREVEIHHQTA